MIRSLLAIVHEASRTGSPMNLLHLLRWITQETGTEVTTVVVEDGPLRPEFERIGEVVVLDRWKAQRAAKFLHLGLQRYDGTRPWHAAALGRYSGLIQARGPFDLVYANSIFTAALLPYLPHRGAVVVHAHELDVSFRSWKRTPEVEAFRTRPDRWIAASAAVKEMLVTEAGIAPDAIGTFHEFIDVAAFEQRAATHADLVAEHRRRSTGGTDAAVVMGAGTVHWRKGPDLFVQLAAEVRRRTSRPVRFVWVGDGVDSTEFEWVRSDQRRAGADHVEFVGGTEDPAPWFAAADVFALTSREDPLPLVCLEAAALGRPLVTYRNGGVVELLDAAGPAAACGIADHLDVGGMADRVIALLDDRDLRDRAATEVQDRVRSHHDVNAIAPQLWQFLQDTVTAAQDRP